MAKNSYKGSRRTTPWDCQKDKTATQAFLYAHYKEHYQQRHPALSEAGEANMVNSFVPQKCPFCNAEHFIKRRHDGNGIQRYKCLACIQFFKPTTGTIFDSRRIPVSEWMEYCLNIFRHVSLNADSWNNKNAFSTSKYWLEKLFLTHADYQNNIVLGEDVWLDETFFSVVMSERLASEDGKLLRGLSKNQICIGVATNKKQTICIAEGNGKPSNKRSYEAFINHIEAGATLYHDKESTHKKLVDALELTSKGTKQK